MTGDKLKKLLYSNTHYRVIRKIKTKEWRVSMAE